MCGLCLRTYLGLYPYCRRFSDEAASGFIHIYCDAQHHTMLIVALVVALVVVLSSPVAWSQSVDTQVHLNGALAVSVFHISDRTYALAGSTGAIQVADVTDPHSLVPVSSVTAQTPGFEDMRGVIDIEIMTMSGSTYAIAADYVAGIVWVIDVSSPHSPTYVSQISAATLGFDTMGSPTAVEELPFSGDPHLMMTSAGAGTLHIVDMVDPSSPEAASLISASSVYALEDPRDVKAFHTAGGTYAVVASFGNDAIMVLDVTNPDAPRRVAQVENGDSGFSGLIGPEAIEVSGTLGRTYAYVAGGGSNVIQVIDVTNPHKPVASHCIWHKYADSVRTAEMDVIPHKTDLFFRTSPNTAIHVQSTLGERSGQIDCVWRGLHERDTVNHPADMVVFEIADQTYLLSTGTDKIHIIDVTKPWEATSLAFVDDGDGASLEDPYGLATYSTPNGTYGLVASFGDDSLQVLDVTEPSTPAAAGNLDSTILKEGLVWPADTSVFGALDFTYVLASSSRDDSIQIVDITDPAAPMLLYDMRGNSDVSIEEPAAVETYWYGGRLHGLVAEQNSILVFDATNPLSPHLTYAIPDAAEASILHVEKIYGRPHLLAVYNNTVNVFDMTDPTSPEMASSLNVPSGISDIETFRISNITYASLSFRGHDAVYLHKAVSEAALSAVTDHTTGLEPLWIFSRAETSAVFDRTVVESAAAEPPILLISLEDPSSPQILEPWAMQDIELDDTTDTTVFITAGRIYVAAIDRFDYEVKILDITRPDTWGSITSQAIDGKNGFEALARPMSIESFHIQNSTYGVVAGEDGRLQLLDLSIPWLLKPVASVAGYLAVPHAQGLLDLEVFEMSDSTFILISPGMYAPHDDAVVILDVTRPDMPVLAGGWLGR